MNPESQKIMQMIQQRIERCYEENRIMCAATYENVESALKKLQDNIKTESGINIMFQGFDVDEKRGTIIIKEPSVQDGITGEWMKLHEFIQNR